MTPYLLHHFLDCSAQKTPDGICLVHGKERVSYAEMATGANRITRVLQDCGLRRGDRVGLMSANSVFFAQCFHGILQAGGIVVPMNTAANADTLAYSVRDCGAKILIAGRGTLRVVQGALTLLPDLTHLWCEGATRLKEVPPHVACEDLIAARSAREGEPIHVRLIDQDVACIVYTSGSTGKARGATLTHLNCVANVEAVVRYLELVPQDRVLAVLPFYYIYGMSVLNTHIAAGATVVIENRFLYPQVAVDAIDTEQCTGFSGVPSTFAILLNRTDFAKREFPRLRYVTQAGGAMSPALQKRLLEVLPGKRIFIMYGATEAAGRLSYLPSEHLADNIGCIGKAIDNVELLLLKPDGSPAAPGEVGEIVARGSCIMRGYWGAPEETAKALDDNGYRTGDLAICEPSGYFRIVGRKKDMIKSGAHRISAKEIEEAILECSDVHEAAVIGVPDEILGEAIHAYVVTKEKDAPLPSLEGFLAARLPKYKLPKSIETRQDLPKSQSGKIMKEVLREEYRSKSVPLSS
ncbi:class I adenylate-forming enzyme family protein [Myxococcota bacterium]